MVRISSWGRLDSHEHDLVPIADRDQAVRVVAGGRGLAQGLRAVMSTCA